MPNQKSMRVIILGSGNVATVLGRAIKKSGHIILQVYDRDMMKAKILAGILTTDAIDSLEDMNQQADIYILALSDVAIPAIARQLYLKNGILVHTAGAVAKNILQGAANKYGVLYPLQSLRKEKEVYQNIPFLVDGSSAETALVIVSFAETLSQLVQQAGDEERLKLHLAAVIVSNFTNHLYALADDFCQKENISFAMLQPLIAEVANRLTDYRAAEMQTGPAVRKDLPTVEKHLLLLRNYPELQAVYAFLSKKIMEM